MISEKDIIVTLELFSNFFFCTGAINKFKEDFTNGAVNIDTCYQTKHLAIGYFTPEEGAELKLEGCNKIILYIPQNALQGSKPQLVYMFLEMYEENLNTMSPRVNCGPDGLKFSVS